MKTKSRLNAWDFDRICDFRDCGGFVCEFGEKSFVLENYGLVKND